MANNLVVRGRRSPTLGALQFGKRPVRQHRTGGLWDAKTMSTSTTERLERDEPSLENSDEQCDKGWCDGPDSRVLPCFDCFRGDAQ